MAVGNAGAATSIQIATAGHGDASDTANQAGGTLLEGAEGVIGSPVLQVWNEMNSISDNLKQDTFYKKIAFSTLVGSTTLASAGFAIWTLRAGYFTAMLLTATPTWATLDVVPLLEFDDAARKKQRRDAD